MRKVEPDTDFLALAEYIMRRTAPVDKISDSELKPLMDARKRRNHQQFQLRLIELSKKHGLRATDLTPLSDRIDFLLANENEIL